MRRRSRLIQPVRSSRLSRLALLASMTALLSAGVAHAASAPTTIGISQSFRDFGLKVPGSYDATKDITQSTSLAGLGINTFRVIVPWDLAMRPSSNGRRQEFENWLARIKAKGGSPYVVFGPTEEATNLVDSSHPTRRTNPTGLVAPYPADFRTAIHRFLELWGPQGSSSIGPPVRIIATWNEPNLAQLEMQLPGHLAGKHPIYMPGSKTRPLYDRGGCGHATASNCGPYLVAKYWNEARQEMAAACPNNGTNCYVVAGEFTGASGPKTKAYWESYADKLVGLSNGLKPAIISFHSHHDFQPEATTGCKPGNKGACTTVAFYKWLKSRGWGDRKIWNTEAGASHYNTTDAEQKKRIEFMLDLLGDYHVKRLYYFNYFPGLATTTDRGLLNRGSNVNTAPRPAYNVIKAVTCPGTCASSSADAFELGAQIAEAEPDSSEPELPAEEAAVQEEFSTDEADVDPDELPVVETEDPGEIVGFEATLKALVSPNDAAVTYHFEYGTTETYGTSTPVVAVSGTDEVPVASTVSGLSAGTTYHYRVVAENEFGASQGADQTLTTSLAQPSAYVSASNHFVYFRSQSGALRQRYWDSGTGLWYPTELGGAVAGDSTAFVGPDGNHYVYYRGTNGAIWQRYWDKTTGQWYLSQLGGSAAGDPVAYAASNGYHFVYFRGTNGALWQWQWDNSTKQWYLTQLGGSIAGQPTAFVGPDGNHYVYYRGTNGAIWQRYWDKTTGQWYLSQLGGSAAGDPVAYAASNGYHFVYFRGTNGALWQWQWDNSTKQWYLTQLGGSIAGQPTAFVGPDGNHYVYYRGTNGAIWQRYWDKTTGQWYLSQLGGSAAGDPVAYAASNGYHFVYFQSSSSYLWQWQWDNTAKQWYLTQLGS